MSDDDIIERGGAQEDIDAYAHDVGGACGAVYDGSCDYCGKVTPTEQDSKEELVDNTDVGIILSDYLGSEWNGNMRDDIVAMVNSKFTADRKRVALEARIDEINYLDDNFQVDSQDWEREHPGYSTAMIPMEDYRRRRTELKVQQEEV